MHTTIQTYLFRTETVVSTSTPTLAIIDTFSWTAEHLPNHWWGGGTSSQLLIFIVKRLMSKLEISFHSFFLLAVPKREPKHGLNCSIVPGLPSLALPCCIAWYALSCTPFLHCIVLFEVCLEQRDVTEPCMHTAHKPSPKKAEMRRREKELNVNQSFPKIWAKYQCNVWGGVLVWLGLWSVFCWRASNPINHLYLALSPNLLSIQETLGERGVCLLFCYLTRLLMGQASRYPL